MVLTGLKITHTQKNPIFLKTMCTPHIFIGKTFNQRKGPYENSPLWITQSNFNIVFEKRYYVESLIRHRLILEVPEMKVHSPPLY